MKPHKYFVQTFIFFILLLGFIFPFETLFANNNTKIEKSKNTPIIRVRLYEGKIKNIHLKKNHFSVKDTHVLFKRKIIKFKKNIAIFDTEKDFVIIGGYRYNKKIIIIKNQKGDVQVINQLSIEDYLAGVLGGEISYSWPNNAIETQAISARSYAYYLYNQNKNNVYHIISGEIHQVFHGSYEPNPRFIKAIKKTKGEILIYKGKSIQTFFHATCGGMTEKPYEVWGGEVKNKIYQNIRCRYCKTHAKYKWEYVLPKKLLKEKGISAIRVSHRSFSKRVKVVHIVRNGKIEKLSGDEFRKMLGYRNVLSTAFSVHKRGRDFVAKGFGYGHGVGLCQWGAKTMAERGYSYRSILSFYYRNTQIKKVY